MCVVIAIVVGCSDLYVSMVVFVLDHKDQVVDKAVCLVVVVVGVDVAVSALVAQRSNIPDLNCRTQRILCERMDNIEVCTDVAERKAFR